MAVLAPGTLFMTGRVSKVKTESATTCLARIGAASRSSISNMSQKFLRTATCQICRLIKTYQNCRAPTQLNNTCMTVRFGGEPKVEPQGTRVRSCGLGSQENTCTSSARRLTRTYVLLRTCGHMLQKQSEHLRPHAAVTNATNARVPGTHMHASPSKINTTNG